MGWIERELDELLREEFRKRGFYLLGNGLTKYAPMPNGFKSREKATEFLEIEEDEYRYVAYKNMAVLTGYGENNEQVTGCIFIKIGSLRREPYPIVELTAFYQNRMYKYVADSHGFNRRMEFVRKSEDIKDAVKILFDDVDYTVNTWQKSVRTLIVENRWPEEEYISNVDFLG